MTFHCLNVCIPISPLRILLGPPTLAFPLGGFWETPPRAHLQEVEHCFRFPTAVTYSAPKYFSYVVLPWSLARHSVLSLNRRFLVSDWNKQNVPGQSGPFLPNLACVKGQTAQELGEYLH